jgi:Phage portal protein, SPP1 Gp6-like
MGIDISKLSPEQLDRFIHLQSLVDRQQSAAQKVKAARDYYNGDHPIMLTQRQQEFLGKQLTEGEFPFNHNVVKSVIDTLRERLSVEGFTVNGQAAGDGSAEAQMAALLWQWWKDSGMDGQQIRLHRRALRDGKSYLIVDYDQANNRPRFNLHEVDDGRTGIVLHRDPSDENSVMFASRYLYTFDPLSPGQTGIERKTVYLPGETRKYRRNQRAIGAWEPIMDDGDLSWPLPWLDPRSQPLGAAVIEWQKCTQ